MKANSKDVTIKNLAKLLLNSLIGRCGMHPIQPITKIFFKDKVGDILLTRKVTQEVEITQNHTLLSYLPGPDSDLIQEFELDDNKVCLKDLCNVDKQTFIKNISIPVAAAVTSYARIFMSKVKLDILKNNGKIFYSDTDSIITDIELDKSLVDDKQIGKFKLEYDIDLAVMPAPKVYCLKLKDPDNILPAGKKIIMKAKGGSTRNLTIEDFIRMVDLVPMDIRKKSSITD
ncbi:putative DNA polymerase [Golovinomyces cichoracearum]|nr:putative DNA polymerase [Golovinomyces cichoracearum]